MIRTVAGLVLVVTALLVSCSPRTPTEIDLAEARWEESAPERYRLVVLKIRGIWHVQVVRLEMEGKKIMVENASCVPAPMEGSTCMIEPYRGENYTIAGLFATIRHLSESDDADFVSITYNAALGYPELISVDDPAVYDDEVVWQVRSFEVLP